MQRRDPSPRSLVEVAAPADLAEVVALLASDRGKWMTGGIINVDGKVPVLVDDDLVLSESVAIVLYLAEKYPQKGFLPADLQARAEVYRWLLFTATELEQPLWRIARHTHQYPIEKRLAAEIPIARQNFLDMAAVMEEHLETRPVLVGENVTVADLRRGIHARHGERGGSARGLAESAGVHGADVRTAQGTAAHRPGVREPPRLRSRREAATASRSRWRPRPAGASERSRPPSKAALRPVR